MTSPDTTLTNADRLDQLANRIVAAARQAQARTEPGLLRAMARLLADGEPVIIAALAEATGRPESGLSEILAGWPDIEFDETGRIEGYGLTLRPTRHRFEVHGRQLYVFCAEDALILSAALGSRARVESTCPATATPVRLTVDPSAAVIALDPTDAVISHTIPAEAPPARSARESLCDQSNFFASPAAAGDWLAGRPDRTVLGMADAWQLALKLNDALL